ncbi:MAG TPA: hypothetical protein VG839_03575 [Asticcacaulis sp.]|nr:hypothetical protein [Asticcacaulis sp.]
MAQEQVTPKPTDRVRILQDKLRDKLGEGPSMIETPEEARKNALLQKVRAAG